MKTSYLIGGIIIFLLIGGFLLLRQGQPSQEGQGEEIVELGPSFEISVGYEDSGYTPREIKVKRGDTVVFTNGSSQPMWTASAIHPVHEVYPGTSISKCGTPEVTGMFDACEGAKPGESWSFQFNEAGTWGYHNHLRPTHTGKIIVE